MDGCTKGPQLEEGENLNTGAPGPVRTPLGGTSTPTGQAQRGPSLAFVKKNIDILITMINELDNRGQEKSKSVKSKPQSVRASRRKSSSDSGYDTVSDSGSEDLSMPYRRPKPMPFTSRITRFRYHRRAKLPPNVWTLIGSTRNWFDSLDPKSVNRFEELSNKFLEEFSQHKRHGHPELAKKLNDKIPKIVDEMWERVRAFIRGEMVANTTEVIRSPRREGFTPLTKTLKEILIMDNVNFPPSPSMVGTLEKGSGLRKIGSSGERNQARRLKEQGLSQRKKEVSARYMLMAVVLQRLCSQEKSVTPLRVIDPEVTMKECGKTQTVIMEFAVVKIPSPYNALLGRTGMRSLGVVASTIHSMIEFLTSNGIATIATTRETLRECRQIEEAQALSWYERVTNPNSMQTSSEVINPRVSLAPAETRSRKPGKEPMRLDDMEERRRKVVDGSWRMYIDFKDLNKACPKDLYPLPEIDWKIESLMGFQYKCFLDAYKGYHQIQMTKKDEEKTAFHTEEGVFCYTEMPFGLKNTGATYQSERSLPFLDTLKKCTNKKDFRWTEVAEAVFMEMKKLIFEFPTLTTPKKGETLMMYLFAANEAVSAMLLMKRDGRQMHIHYVSRSLQGSETNYVLIEKLALALVHAARWLRRYFQADPIKVITDNPIGQLLNNSGVSGRLEKWAIELGVYGITYVPKVAVKGKVLADFLADTSTEINATPEVANTPRVEDIPESSNARDYLTPGLRAWRLYTDEALKNGGSRAGLILIAPDDVEYSYVLRLDFSNSNNNAEDEALLAGLRIATEMQVKDIHAFVDFKLVARRSTPLALVEVLNERSVEVQEVNMVVEEEGPTWMTPIRNYLEKGILSEDPVDARTLMEKIRNYTMEDRVVAKAMNLESTGRLCTEMPES
ncbi:reverse transcriptase domain-containing protein [Tanacetum coccineum]